MKKIILIILFVVMTAGGCKCPTCPDLPEVIEPKPTAQILFTPGVTTISYWQLVGQFALREVKGVECRVTNVRLTVSFNGDSDASWSYTSGSGNIDIGTGIVPANGKLTIYFRAQLPYYSQPRNLLIKVYLTDEHGHKLEVYDVVLLS